jgi:hypothetical protein
MKYEAAVLWRSYVDYWRSCANFLDKLVRNVRCWRSCVSKWRSCASSLAANTCFFFLLLDNFSPSFSSNFSYKAPHHYS